MPMRSRNGNERQKGLSGRTDVQPGDSTTRTVNGGADEVSENSSGCGATRGSVKHEWQRLGNSVANGSLDGHV